MKLTAKFDSRKKLASCVAVSNARKAADVVLRNAIMFEGVTRMVKRTMRAISVGVTRWAESTGF